MHPETIRALTPLFLASIGGVIGITVLVTPGLRDAQWSAGLGLAGTAIAGAAGLAQNTKNEANIAAPNARVQVEGVQQPSNEKAAS